MPTQWAHEFYWNVSSTVVPPPPVPPLSCYPAWGGSVIAGSLAGGLQPWYERLAALIARWRRRLWIRERERVLLDRIAGLDAERQRVLDRTLRALSSPAYATAQKAVEETAHTLGFTARESWIPYSRMLKQDRGRAENVFRHLRACERTREELSSTLTNPEVNLAVELAYCGYAVKGRYFDGVR